MCKLTCKAKWRLWSGVLLWLALALPFSRAMLEASMVRHMLLQIPLLTVAGYLLASGLPGTWRQQAWNKGGICALIVFSWVALLWMIPRSMDAAIELWWVEGLKFIGVPIGMGMMLAMGWSRAGFVVRGVFLLELSATWVRAGWLYKIAPERLCANYLLNDQWLLGNLLIGAGVGLWIVLIWIVVFGHPHGSRLKQ